MLLFFPETCRQIVGDGSIPPPAWSRSLLNILSDRRKRREGINMEEEYDRRDELSKKRRIRFPNPLTTLRLLFQLPTGLILLANGIGYGSFWAVTSSIPAEFAAIYNLNDLQIGLTYIPIGLGTIFSSFVNGWAADRNFKRIASRHGGIPSIKNGRQDLAMFPIEHARLQIAIPSSIAGAIFIAAYGWVLHYELPLWVAMAFLFFIGYFMTASYNIMNVLIVDLNYDTPATATAANNLVRCFIGAAATATIVPLLGHLGRGMSYTIVAGIWTVTTTLTIIVYAFGLRWRQVRDAGEEADVEG
jgi:hypothetical protein